MKNAPSFSKRPLVSLNRTTQPTGVQLVTCLCTIYFFQLSSNNRRQKLYLMFPITHQLHVGSWNNTSRIEKDIQILYNSFSVLYNVTWEFQAWGSWLQLYCRPDTFCWPKLHCCIWFAQCTMCLWCNIVLLFLSATGQGIVMY